MTSCPSPQTLGRLGSGLAGETSNPSLDAHVNQCGACQAVLDRIAHEDPATMAPVAVRVRVTRICHESRVSRLVASWVEGAWGSSIWPTS